MATTSSFVEIGRTSSIESEPRTLDFHQMQFAREAALYVLNTKSMEEAFEIFTQGLEPVTSLRGRRRDALQETSMESEETDSNDDHDDEEEESCTNSLFRLSTLADVSPSSL